MNQEEDTILDVENISDASIQDQVNGRIARTTAVVSPKPKKKASTRQSKRHGARNQHRHKYFVKWLLETFDLEASKSNVPTDEAAEGATTFDAARESDEQFHILDVAGGKGEVSARLTMCHQQQVIMVDPRPSNIVDCYEKIVLPKIPNKWQRRVHDQKKSNPNFVENIVSARFLQLVTTFDTAKLQGHQTKPGRTIQMKDLSLETPAVYHRTKVCPSDLQKAVQKASLIVGLHADGATEAIVDAALQYDKPFVVVPCCVFPNFFPMRRILADESKHAKECKWIPVRTHEQFCTYLLRKDPRFVMEELPFEGRNIAIWWSGK